MSEHLTLYDIHFSYCYFNNQIQHYLSAIIVVYFGDESHQFNWCQRCTLRYITFSLLL